MTEIKQQVAQRIRELYTKHGTITPDLVIEDAKNPDSPLNGEFEWDLEKAALEAWREKARTLIRSVVIVVNTETKTFVAQGYQAPEFVRDPSAKGNEQGYVRIYDVKRNRENAVSALLYEIDRINAALARARAICIELGLDTEYDIVIDAVKSIRKKATTV